MTISTDTPGESVDVEEQGSSGGFSVKVGDFEGPFDLLLSLISKHKLEVTELALHQVTDEFSISDIEIMAAIKTNLRHFLIRLSAAGNWLILQDFTADRETVAVIV